MRHAARAGASYVRWLPTRRLRHLAGATDRLPPGSTDIALTFDDGPHPEWTPKVLDLLAAAEVRATFFLVGCRVRQHPELVRRIWREGHVLGSHSTSHPDARRLGVRRLRRDYADGRAALEAVVGAQVTLFRPPNGTIDLKGATVMRRLGLAPLLWTVDPRDWHPDTTAAQIIARAAAAGAGDIVLLHDGLERPLAPRALDRSATVEALPRVIAGFRERGLGFTTPVPR
jgi:peptidoglycan/xylan/chitin deacetylase (PgdA/CDA1 family)